MVSLDTNISFKSYKPIKANLKEILLENSKFYNNLSAENKKKFEFRVVQFLKNVTIEAEGNYEVDDVVRVFVASAAVQISFGLRTNLHARLRKVILTNNIVYHKQIKSYVKGLFTPKGEILLSYPHFVKDFRIHNDGVNLGLHEMAHALEFFFYRKTEYKIFFYDLVKDWFVQVSKRNEFQRPDNVNGFIREYGATNIHEFFAVCVENFFERPQEFKNRLPLVYNHLSFLLGQDLLRTPRKDNEIKALGNRMRPQIKEKVRIIDPFFMGIIIIVPLYAYFFKVNFEFATAVYISSAALIIALIKYTFSKSIEFYNDFILFKPVVFGKLKSIHIDNLMSITIYDPNKSKVRNTMVFMYYNNGVDLEKDFYVPSQRFEKKVAEYANQKDILFVDKIGL